MVSLFIGLHYITDHQKYTTPKKLERGDAGPMDLGKLVQLLSYIF